MAKKGKKKQGRPLGVTATTKKKKKRKKMPDVGGPDKRKKKNGDVTGHGQGKPKGKM